MSTVHQNVSLLRVCIPQVLSTMKKLYIHTILHQILFISNNYHQNSTLVMEKVGCLVNLVALVVGFLGGSVQKVDLYVVVKKKGRLQVLDCK